MTDIGFLYAGYGVIWMVLGGYLSTMGRRQAGLKRDLSVLTGDPAGTVGIGGRGMEPPVSLKGYNPGLRQVLGDLEAEIMECVGQMGSASVRDVHEVLLGRRHIAYTTVMTVMSRLAEKGLLARRQDGRRVYSHPRPDTRRVLYGRGEEE